MSSFRLFYSMFSLSWFFHSVSFPPPITSAYFSIYRSKVFGLSFFLFISDRLFIFCSFRSFSFLSLLLLFILPLSSFFQHWTALCFKIGCPFVAFYFILFHYIFCPFYFFFSFCPFLSFPFSITSVLSSTYRSQVFVLYFSHFIVVLSFRSFYFQSFFPFLSAWISFVHFSAYRS